MQVLQRTIQQIGAQLKGLPNTAKMLIGSLMIILVMSLFLVSLYAGRQRWIEYVAVMVLILIAGAVVVLRMRKTGGPDATPPMPAEPPVH